MIMLPIVLVSPYRGRFGVNTIDLNDSQLTNAAFAVRVTIVFFIIWIDRGIPIAVHACF